MDYNYGLFILFFVNTFIFCQYKCNCTLCYKCRDFLSVFRFTQIDICNLSTFYERKKPRSVHEKQTEPIRKHTHTRTHTFATPPRMVGLAKLLFPKTCVSGVTNRTAKKPKLFLCDNVPSCLHWNACPKSTEPTVLFFVSLFTRSAFL